MIFGVHNLCGVGFLMQKKKSEISFHSGVIVKQEGHSQGACYNTPGGVLNRCLGGEVRPKLSKPLFSA